MKTNEALHKLSEFKGVYHYKLRVSLEDGTRIYPEEIQIEDPLDPDEVGKWYAVQKVHSLLEEAFSLVRYYQAPVIGEGRLEKMKMVDMNWRDLS